MIRAAVMSAPKRPVELRDLPDPELEPDSAMMRTTYGDVCGTDVHLREGRLSGVPYPIIPGHVSVGVLEDIRGTVRDVEGNVLREGAAVTFFDVNETCNSCWACLVAKSATRCPDRKVYGITYGLDDGLLGGWCEKMYLKPGVRIIPLPEGVDDRTMVAAGCGLPTAYHAVERATLEPGDTVLVQGCGPVGIQAVAMALAFGAGRVFITGAPVSRLELAQRFGAEVAIDISAVDETARREQILELTSGRGVDRVIEATGNPRAVPEALRLARDGGAVVIAGHYTDAGEISINPHHDINRKHLDIRGCWGSEFRHFHRSIQLLGRIGSKLPYADMISRVYPLAEADRALDDVESLSVIKAVIDPST